MYKVTLFVPCNDDDNSDVGYRFPRLRLVLVLRRFFDDRTLGITLARVDDKWPVANRELPSKWDWNKRGDRQGIRLALICDDAGIGRITRVLHSHPAMDMGIECIEDLELGPPVFVQ